MPAPPSAFLAVGLPDWAAVRGFRVPHSSQEWFRFRLFTGSVVVRAAPLYKERTRYFPFWVRPVSVFGLFAMTVFKQRFRCLNLAIQSDLLPRRHLQKRLGLTTSAWLTPSFFVSVASHDAVASLACTDRLRATERPVSCRPTATAKQRTARLSRRTYRLALQRAPETVLANKPPLLWKCFSNRRSWLFSDTVAGAKASALIYSLTLTCRACGAEPYGYLLKVFTKLLQRAPDVDISDLLPFNFAKQQAVTNNYPSCLRRCTRHRTAVWPARGKKLRRHRLSQE
jgi:hypothetical protein